MDVNCSNGIMLSTPHRPRRSYLVNEPRGEGCGGDWSCKKNTNLPVRTKRRRFVLTYSVVDTAVGEELTERLRYKRQSTRSPKRYYKHAIRSCAVVAASPLSIKAPAVPSSAGLGNRSSSSFDRVVVRSRPISLLRNIPHRSHLRAEKQGIVRFLRKVNTVHTKTV